MYISQSPQTTFGVALLVECPEADRGNESSSPPVHWDGHVNTHIIKYEAQWDGANNGPRWLKTKRQIRDVNSIYKTYPYLFACVPIAMELNRKWSND